MLQRLSPSCCQSTSRLLSDVCPGNPAKPLEENLKIKLWVPADWLPGVSLPDGAPAPPAVCGLQFTCPALALGPQQALLGHLPQESARPGPCLSLQHQGQRFVLDAHLAYGSIHHDIYLR